jgi:hypothetical protein
MIPYSVTVYRNRTETSGTLFPEQPESGGKQPMALR